MSNSNWMRQNGSKQSNILVDKCIGVKKKKRNDDRQQVWGAFYSNKTEAKKVEFQQHQTETWEQINPISRKDSGGTKNNFGSEACLKKQASCCKNLGISSNWGRKVLRVCTKG